MPSPGPAAGVSREAGRAGAGRPDMRLPRERRILESRLFRETFDQGRRYVGSFMVLWLRTGPKASLRLGVVTSRRSFRRSVDRSLVRRRLREAFRRNRFRLRDGADVILVGRTRMLEARSAEVEAEFLRLAARAGMMGKAESGTQQ